MLLFFCTSFYLNLIYLMTKINVNFRSFVIEFFIYLLQLYLKLLENNYFYNCVFYFRHLKMHNFQLQFFGLLPRYAYQALG